MGGAALSWAPDVKRSGTLVALAFAVAAGCGRALPRPRPVVSPAQQLPRSGSLTVAPEAPPWTYWEPIESPVLAAQRAPMELPIPVAQLVRAPGLETRWAAAPPAMRDALAARGFALSRRIQPSVRLGDFYAALREDQIPIVITLDALFFLAHLALDRAFAEVDAHTLAPLVTTMLHRLDARLSVEGRTAPADLAPSYVVARGLVGVALALAEPKYQPSPALSRFVGEEKARVLSHAGVAFSPWFDMPIDYSALTPVGMADHDPQRANRFRATSWLENASLALQGVGEGTARGQVDIATARVHARAAMLLSRLLDQDVDAEAARAWEKIEGSSELLIGDSDEVTPRDITAAVSRADLDPRSAAWIANVVRADSVRHAVARGRVAPSFRLLGPRATPDGELLQSLTFPLVGPKTSVEPSSAGGAGAVRALPSALDVAAWLGSQEARAALHASGGDAYGGYQDALDRSRLARPEDTSPWAAGRHRTPYLSMIDAIETWLLPSEGDSVQPAALTAEWRKRKARVALAAWTELRHDATALTRVPLDAYRLPARAPGDVSVPVFVEPHPEAIAKILGFVRQTARALVGEGALKSDSEVLQVFGAVDDLLWAALGAAVHETADDSLPPSLAATLAAFPAGVQALEAAVGDSGAAEVPLAVTVHVDMASELALEETIGRIEEVWLVMREPRTHRLWVALGAAIPHYELVLPAAQRSSDGAWRARLQTEGDPAPGPLARDHVF
jgi:uncharacterized protein DUF3160